jgi:hypothetical protein
MMGLDTVLSYSSLSRACLKLQDMGATDLAHRVYAGYDGSQLPSEREAYLRGAFAAQPPAPPGVPYGAAEILAYVTRLCHAVWVEENAGLSWSLQDYDPEAIGFLLDRWTDTRGWTSDGKGEDGCWGTIWGGATVTREPVANEWYKAFPLSFYVSGQNSSRLEAAQRFITWIMMNFFHAYDHPVEDSGWDTYGVSDHRLIPLARLFDERIVGCHSAASILAAMLRSVNIPAIEVHYAQHGVCWMPTLGRTVHGDYLADYALLEDNSILLMTRAELERWLFDAKGYMSFEVKIEKKDSHTGVALRRRGRSLYVAHVPSASEDSSKTPPLQQVSAPGFYADLQKRLPQFGIHRVGNEYYSKLVPILGLDELSAYGLALAIDKDANDYVVITLRNQGQYRLPSSEGLLLIEIDGVVRGGYDLPRLDPGFVEQGGHTVVRTNFQIGADEDGIVRATVSRLPASSQRIEVTRHLGRPLEPIRPGTVTIP